MTNSGVERLPSQASMNRQHEKTPDRHPFEIQAECVLGALANAGMSLSDVDGFATAAALEDRRGRPICRHRTGRVDRAAPNVLRLNRYRWRIAHQSDRPRRGRHQRRYGERGRCQLRGKQLLVERAMG